MRKNLELIPKIQKLYDLGSDVFYWVYDLSHIFICFRKMQVELVQSIGVINSIFVDYFLIECVA